MTTAWTSLTGVLRRNFTKMNTVHFAKHLKPLQPVPIRPSTDRTPNISAQSAFEFCLIVQVFEGLHDHAIYVLEVVKEFLCDLVHPLFEGTSCSLLAVRAVATAFDSFDDRLDVESELVPGF